MVDVSLISSNINNLNEEITNFKNNYLFNDPVACDSDCFCRKEGNHKVTKSAYHKDCIKMKRNSAPVKKSDVVRPRNKSCERKEIFNVGRTQVEVSLKGCNKEKKNINEKSVYCDGVSSHGKTKKAGCSEKPKKLVDTGCDPISVVESKPRRCWSSILSENSKSDIPLTSSMSYVPYERPIKLQSTITTSSSGAIQSQNSKHSIIVRDRGIQCQDNLDAKRSTVNGHPVDTLQHLLNELRKINRTNDRFGNSELYPVISEMEQAIQTMSKNGSKYYPLPQNMNEDKSSGYFYSVPSKDGPCVAKPSRSKLEKNLEETVNRLQSSCYKLEQTCKKLVKEKENISDQFFEKSKELENCLKRELDYQKKLSDAHQSVEIMSKKLDDYSKSMQDLSIHISKLQAENKALAQADEVKHQIINQLMEAKKENEKLNMEVQLMTLEREKNQVLLDIKEQELTKLKAELRSIGGLVSEKMLATALTNESLAVSSKMDLSDSHDLAFSSPDGSIAPPSKSWKDVSTIFSSGNPAKLLPKRREDLYNLSGGDQKNPIESINHLRNQLKDLFQQMKQQTEKVVQTQDPTGHEISAMSTVTNTSGGYNTISENETSE